MAYRPRDIYKGRRKFRVPLTIFLSVLVFLIAGTVVMFYTLQRFIVYDQTGVTLQLPFMQTEAEVEEEAAPEVTFVPIQVEIVYEDPDFSQVDLGGWEELAPAELYFIDFNTAVNSVALASAISTAQNEGYTGVVLELKSPQGQLAWQSTCETAVSYGTAGVMDYTQTLQTLHDAGLTAVAQISCCADKLLSDRNWTVTLQTGGSTYRNEDGIGWLDPYNRTVRNYIADLMRELAAMGFDEILLADLYHPYSENGFQYSVTLQTAPNPVTAVCQMAKRLVEAMEGTGVAVSALLDEDSLRNGDGNVTGQDMTAFWRIFARLYCPSESGTSADNKVLAMETMTQGEIDVRFIPVTNDAPDGFESYCIRAENN